MTSPGQKAKLVYEEGKGWPRGWWLVAGGLGFLSVCASPPFLEMAWTVVSTINVLGWWLQ